MQHDDENDVTPEGVPVFDPDTGPPPFDPDDYEPATRILLTPGQMMYGLRKRNTLTQAELETLTGIPQSTLSGIESGRIKLGVERAKVIAEALNVHPSLILFSDYKSPDAA